MKVIRSKSINYARKGDFRLSDILAFKSNLVPMSYIAVGIFQILHLVFHVFMFQTGEKLFELHGHTQKITAIAPFSSPDASEEKKHLILTASADRTVIVSLDLEKIQISMGFLLFFIFKGSIEAGCRLFKGFRLIIPGRFNWITLGFY